MSLSRSVSTGFIAWFETTALLSEPIPCGDLSSTVGQRSQRLASRSGDPGALRGARTDGWWGRRAAQQQGVFAGVDMMMPEAAAIQEAPAVQGLHSTLNPNLYTLTPTHPLPLPLALSGEALCAFERLADLYQGRTPTDPSAGTNQGYLTPNTPLRNLPWVQGTWGFSLGFTLNPQLIRFLWIIHLWVIHPKHSEP